MKQTADTMHSVAVIGDGVAGLAAVRTLQLAGLTPTLIAPSRTRSSNRGELLGPRALTSLNKLGWRHLLVEERVAMPAEARFSAWGSPALVRHRGDSELGPGWHLDRSCLESAMQASIAIHPLHRIPASTLDVIHQGDAWLLSLTTGEELHARFVVDCSGRVATVARRHGGRRRRDDRLVAMHHTFPLPESGVMSASLVESTPGGWWYTAPMPGQKQLFAAYFSDTDLLPHRSGRSCDPGLLTAAPYTRARLESLDLSAPDAPWDIVVASTTSQERVAGDGWAAAGDAAVALDPLAGHGLTVALWSARQAANGARDWLNGDSTTLKSYKEAVETGVARFVADLDRHYRSERRFQTEEFWARRRVEPAPIDQRARLFRLPFRGH